jgi:hypothetical protein
VPVAAERVRTRSGSRNVARASSQVTPTSEKGGVRRAGSEAGRGALAGSAMLRSVGRSGLAAPARRATSGRASAGASPAWCRTVAVPPPTSPTTRSAARRRREIRGARLGMRTVNVLL